MAVKRQKTWRRVKSVEELNHLASLGVRVRCDHDMLLHEPRKAEAVMGFASRGLVAIIKKGLMYEADPSGDGAEPESILSRAQIAIRGTGLSTTEIAKLAGVTRQAASQFLTAKSAQTRVLDKYLLATGVSI